MRWFFYYLTVDTPIGGLKHARLTASLLRELGIETFLLRDTPRDLLGAADDNRFYNIPVPEAPFSVADAAAHLRPEDVLVLPEVPPLRLVGLSRGWRCRLALYNQNGFYALRLCPTPQQLGRPFAFAIANAPYVAGVCETFLGIPRNRIFLVPYWVLREPFVSAEADQRRQLAICCMPRKLSEQVQQVRDSVQRTNPDVPWIEIDGVSTEEVARRFQNTAIFFSTQHLEGFGLPALEAMACGALVAGYPGTGRFPHPYARPANGLWVRDGDVTGAAAAVRRAITVIRSGGEELSRFLAAGRETAQRYSKEASLRALSDLLKQIANPGMPLRRSSFRLGWRGKLAALRVLYECNRLGWLGQAISWLSARTKPLRLALAARR